MWASVGCLEDELNLGDQIVGSGDEVLFGLSLNDPTTKTIYGPQDGIGFPLYWSEGDKIQIASPHCEKGRNQAEYLVTPRSGQSYADAMTKTGDYGVQWGSYESADFYSIYPSNGVSWPTLTSSNVVAKLNIASGQSANLVLTPAEIEESKDDEGNIIATTIKTPGWYQAADMENVIMYSYAQADKGAVVDLKYIPYSTILEFELGIEQNRDQQNQLTTWGTVKVASITLTAPSGINIAGDFNLKFNGSDAPTITAAGNNSNSVKMLFASQPLLSEENQTLKAKLAMIPIGEVASLDGWTIAVEVLYGKDATTTTHTKTIKNSGETTALVPGKIHKIVLPKFSTIEKWEVNTEAWIPTLEDYTRIYLTELSLPGAWYAAAKTGDGYQSTQKISDLWKAGVRAFAVECKSQTGGMFSSTPNGISISGTASKCALNSGQYGGDRLSGVIKDVAGAVTSDEFAVLMISYADGGNGRRDVDFEYFIKGLKTEITNSGVSDKIYSSEVTSQTTVKDVMGKVIIKVNVDDNLPLGDYTNDQNILFSYNPFMQQLPKDDNGIVDYAKIRFSELYWKKWSDDYKDFSTVNNSDFLWCFASANRTQVDGGTVEGIPTYSQRKDALRSMVQHSKEVTASAKHNVWFCFNAGGAQATALTGDTDAAAYTNVMNPWLLNVIKLKANGGTDTEGVFGEKGMYYESEASSLGLVFFNQCTNETYHGPTIIKEIIEMNNKFKLQRANQDAKSAAPSYASGMDTNDSAFGWD